MGDQTLRRLSRDEIEAEHATPLPAKEVFSPLLDLTLDLDLALDLAAPIDLAVAANANVAAPIDAAVAANVLSLGSTSAALADQDVLIDQHISGDAIAQAPQTAVLDQSNDVVDGGTDTGTVGDAPATVEEAAGSPLLNIDVNAAIDAAVAANIGSVASSATAVADQDAIIVQDLDEVVAEATADQDATIEQ